MFEHQKQAFPPFVHTLELYQCYLVPPILSDFLKFLSPLQVYCFQCASSCLCHSLPRQSLVHLLPIPVPALRLPALPHVRSLLLCLNLHDLGCHNRTIYCCLQVIPWMLSKGCGLNCAIQSLISESIHLIGIGPHSAVQLRPPPYI